MTLPRFASLAAGAVFLAQSAAVPALAEFPVGKPAPAFTLRTPDGKPLSLARLRGKVVLLDFWGPT